MPAEVFFDTTILVYAVTKDDPRAGTAEELLAAGGIVSVQVLNELVAVGRRKMRMRWEAIEEILSAVRDLCGEPVPITAKTHEGGVKVAQRFGYHIYDSLMIAAAHEAGCTILYSEDMQHGQRIGSLEIKNPFLI
jgi:predicted nucleic acid-binding protein